MLIVYGVDITPKTITLAIRNDNFDAVEAMLQKKPSIINEENEYTNTPLTTAIIAHNTSIVLLLIQHTNIEIHDILVAVRNRSWEILGVLLLHCKNDCENDYEHVHPNHIFADPGFNYLLQQLDDLEKIDAARNCSDPEFQKLLLQQNNAISLDNDAEIIKKTKNKI